MITKTKTFTSPQFGSVRTAGTPDRPLFSTRDLERALGLKPSAKTYQRVREEDKEVVKTAGCRQGRRDGEWFVTIRGMRDVLLNSKSKKGDLVHSWLSREVVPALTSEKKKGEPEVAPKTEPKSQPVPEGGVIPFPGLEEAIKRREMERFGLEDFLDVIFKLERATAEAADLLGSLSGSGITNHLDNLFESTMKSKDALLDVIKDIIMYTEHRGAIKTA